MDVKKQKNHEDKPQILYDIIVVYIDGVKENFEAIKMKRNKVIIGRIINSKFIDCGIISKNNIKEIKDNNLRKTHCE